ncbi:hypothetical protein OUZ56_000055 [Daphnia magna]|uniref:Uncharacterized protein n=1 Tax=Daphnia magna TaxID=35525 RepID=A0ABQ9ZYK4_9CRUS|nr:hypothetical protein OUZ56_000055 [Daphnia magna]
MISDKDQQRTNKSDMRYTNNSPAKYKPPASFPFVIRQRPTRTTSIQAPVSTTIRFNRPTVFITIKESRASHVISQSSEANKN